MPDHDAPDPEPVAPAACGPATSDRDPVDGRDPVDDSEPDDGRDAGDGREPAGRVRGRRRLVALIALPVALLAGGMVAIASAGANNTDDVSVIAVGPDGGAGGNGGAAGVDGGATDSPGGRGPDPIVVDAAQVQVAVGWSPAELRVEFAKVSFLVVHTDRVRSSWTCVAPGGQAMSRSGRMATTASHAATSTPTFTNEWLHGFTVIPGEPVGESISVSGGSSFLTCPEGPWTVLHGGGGPLITESVERTTSLYVSVDGGSRWSALVAEPG
jgi:hypothetical protein